MHGQMGKAEAVCNTHVYEVQQVGPLLRDFCLHAPNASELENLFALLAEALLSGTV